MRCVTSSTEPSASTWAKHSAICVHLRQRRGLLVIHHEPIADDCIVVVSATFDFSASQESVDDRLRIHREFNDSIDLLAQFQQGCIEVVNLIQGARIPVEQEPGGGISLCQADRGSWHL